MPRPVVSPFAGSLAGALAVAVALGAPRVAGAQEAQVSLESDEVYAGAPFVLTVATDGFDENPAPSVAPFTVAGCKVRPLGASPSVSSSITIINGRRRESRSVRFAIRFELTCDRAGTIEVPALTVSQGGKRVVTRAGQVEVRAIATTPDMALRLGLPERPVSIGETFDVTIDWYLRKDPDDPTFAIPLFDLPAFEVAAPAAGGGRGLAFTIGGRPIELPYAREEATLDGEPYTRFRFTAQVTPLASGTFDLPPARVTARLPTGYGRDAFGFRSARYGQFAAADQPRKLEVAPLPTEGRPASFAGAVGTGFALEVRASHTVVRVGDPIELTLTVRGPAHLEGLGLPTIGGPTGLPAEDFDVPGDRPAGELIEDGKAKRFVVTVRLKRAVGQIPPIEMGYWNPAARRYETAKSQAIALSTGDAATIGATDVVGGRPAAPPGGARPAGGAVASGGVVSVVGADLSPSAPDRTMRPALTMRRVKPFLVGLYVVPTFLLVASLGLRRARRRDAGARRGRTAQRGLARVIEASRAIPARDAVGPLTSALREVLRGAGRSPRAADPLIAELEHLAFDPSSGARPLSTALLDRILAEASTWVVGGGPDATPRGGAGAGTVALLALAIGLGAATAAWAAGADALGTARAAYQGALGEADRVTRTRAFAHAEELYRPLVAAAPDRPELLTDWGNAALGAGELGRAALAYRRALALKPSLERATRNLAWLRAQQPSWAAAADDGGAIDSLLFWHRRLARPTKHAWLAACYALAIVLLTPLGRGRSGRGRRRRLAALAPAAIAIAMAGSIVLERDAADDAIVTAEGVVLRAADSAGAPPAVAEPVPAGVEVTVLERREGWQRVALADGHLTGWLQDGALTAVGDPAGG